MRALVLHSLFLTVIVAGFSTGVSAQDRECVEGNCFDPGFSSPNVLTDELVWENRFGSDDYNSGDPPQYGATCGDDSNEFLIRAHGEGGSQDPDLSKNVYGCSVTPERCLYNSSFYRQGERVDVSDEEAGADSPDYEVCANVNDGVPGGEFYDPDNPVLNNYLVGGGNVDDPSTYDHQVVLEDDKVGAEMSHWITRDNDVFDRAYESPYSNYAYEAGYALENNVRNGNLDTSKGTESTIKDNAVYSFFQHGRKIDDMNPRKPYHDPQDGYTVAMVVDGEIGVGAKNSQMDEVSSPQDWSDGTTSEAKDSEIDKEEYTWGVADSTDVAVGPRGNFYDPGSCYGKDVWASGSDEISKDETEVANSYVKSEDLNLETEYSGSDDFFSDQNDAHWVNPDDTAKSATNGGASCDLTSNDYGYGYDTGGSTTCIQGSCGDDSDPSSPHVVTGDIGWDSGASQYGNACGDDPNEYLLKGYDSDEFSSGGEYACGTKLNRCVYEGEVYAEGEMVDVGDDGGSSEDLGHSPDKEVCLNMDSRPGGTWYDIDDWESTEYIRSKISAAGSRAAALDSEEWRVEWRDHPDPQAVSGSEEFEEPEWYDQVEVHDGPVAVPSNLQDPRGGFAIEDDCQEGLPYDCQDLSSPSYTDRIYGSFNFRGNRPDDYEDGTSDFNLDIVHNQMAFTYGGDTSVGSSNSQDEETDIEISNDFHKSEISEKFNRWGYTDDLNNAIGPFGGDYERYKCYGRERQDDSDVRKTERLFANSFVNYEGEWVNPDKTERTVSEGSLSCDLTGEDWGIGYDNNDEVVVH